MASPSGASRHLPINGEDTLASPINGEDTGYGTRLISRSGT